MFKKHLSYSNVIAVVALFVALGGTAVAAGVLPRDSVGAPQIRTAAVRTAEIRDQGVGFSDISNGAATALRGDVGFTEGELTLVPACSGIDLSRCPDLYVLPLSSAGASGRNWLIQAKLNFFVQLAPESNGTDNRCGLVSTTVAGRARVLDQLSIQQLRTPAADPIFDQDHGMHSAALSAVVKKRAGNPTIAVRCTEQAGEQNGADRVKITALEVGRVIQP